MNVGIGLVQSVEKAIQNFLLEARNTKRIVWSSGSQMETSTFRISELSSGINVQMQMANQSTIAYVAIRITPNSEHINKTQKT